MPCACVISVFSFLNFHRRVFLFHYRIPTDCTRCWYFKTNNRSYTIVHTTIRMIRYKDGEIKVSHIICMSILSFILLFRCPFNQIIEITFWTIVFSLSYLLWEKTVVASMGQICTQGRSHRFDLSDVKRNKETNGHRERHNWSKWRNLSAGCAAPTICSFWIYS